MRHLALLVLLAVSLAACGGSLPVGPVSHACVGNPMKSQGSGCNDSHRD
jgi:hypothetical protein